ncbi:AMP-binding protein [Parahaliea mediterranea]|uniref:AMP-binding protein n=1 Tax=Parahaliea mediterranea TaxID=651086 RepID=UPI003219089D
MSKAEPSRPSAAEGPRDQPLLEETIGVCLERIARRYPDQLALVVRHQGVRWSYREYLREVDRLATGLLALGVEPGDRVGIWAPNCVEWCLTQFATARIGAIMVCINPAYRVHELEYALNKVQCRALVTAERFKSSEYLEMLYKLAPEMRDADAGSRVDCARLPHLEVVVRMGAEPSPGMFNFDGVCAMGGEDHYRELEAIAGRLSPDDPINIQFTSGTTGNPKGATLSHRNILNNGKVVGDGMLLTSADRLCIPVPLYHCFGMVMSNLACVTHGSAAVFPAEAFEPEATLAAVEAEACTALHGVPTMFIAELDCPNFGRYDLSSLRTGIMAGAPCPVEVMKQVIGRMHMSDILIAYGQTETSPVNHMTAVDDPLDKRVNTVGRAGPHLEVKLVGEDGAVVPRGERGEICTRGYSVMRYYWDDDARTRETIDAEGWLHSGDLGVMDDDGYVDIVGRIKDMIIRGGENIYPREIEEFLYTLPQVQDAQVFGIPDEKYGEQVCAWIHLKEGESLTEEEVLAHCRDRIAHFKVPAVLRFVDEFPMTVTGKIQKFRMREQMLDELSRHDNSA